MKMDPYTDRFPGEIYKEILYKSDVRSLTKMYKITARPPFGQKIVPIFWPAGKTEVFSGNKHTANICKNDNFWYDYLKKHYDPKLFLAGENLTWNAETFTIFVNDKKLNSFIKNWKELVFYIEGAVKYVPVYLTVIGNEFNEFNTTVDVRFYDTAKEILAKCDKLFDSMNIELQYEIVLDLICKTSGQHQQSQKFLEFRLMHDAIIILRAPTETSFRPNTYITSNATFEELMLNGYKIFITLECYEYSLQVNIYNTRVL
jgi:hypothetical protein